MTLKVVKSFSRAATTYFSCRRCKLLNMAIYRGTFVQHLHSPTRMLCVPLNSCSALGHRTINVASSSQSDNEQDDEEEEEDWDDEKTSPDGDNVSALSSNILRDRNVVHAVRRILDSAGNEPLMQRRLTEEECVQMRREVRLLLMGKQSSKCVDSTAPECQTQPIIKADITTPQSTTASGDAADSAKLSSNFVAHRTADGQLLKVFRHMGAYGAAFSYLAFLQRHDLFNAATTILACELIYKATINKLATEQEAVDMIAFIEQRFPVTFSLSSAHKLYCDAATSKYKDAAQKLRAEVSNFTSPTRHLILTAACFDHSDSWAAFDILKNLILNRNVFVEGHSSEFKDMCSSACIFLARRAKSHPDNALALFHKFLNLTRNLKVPGLPREVEPLIRDMFASISPTWVVKSTRIARTGKCSLCSTLMPKEELSNREFEEMKKFVMQKLLHGDDIFRSSTPDEMQRFMTQVTASAPYDIVFDALNVALQGLGRFFDPPARAQQLIGVIEDFKTHLGCKTICVVTRRHLVRGAPQQFAYLRKSTSLVLLNDSTVDDPFVLYSALASGPGCYIVSKDRYGFLNTLLGAQAQALFRRWLRTRLITDWQLEVDGKLNLPQSHALSSFFDQDSFHIPLIPKSLQRLDNPVPWLCIRRDNKQPS